MHPDNVGHIVTHLGMNIDQRLQEFKDFENDDQAFWDRVIAGEEPEVPTDVREGSTRLRASDRVMVHGEVVDSLWEEDFTSVEDEQVIADLRERMELLGLDPSRVEELVAQARTPAKAARKSAEPFPKLPQREWEEAKRRLDEEAKRLAKIMLNHVDLTMQGVEIPFKYKTLQINGKSNYVCALMMVNTAIQKRLGKPRGEASTEEFREILDNLDDILKPLVRRLRKAKAKADYEENET